MTLNLGLIGGASGNGHPYSWSAILNGYNPAIMASCPFETIPAYLAKENWPAARLPDVEVTHLFTDPPELAPHIAAACHIGAVCASPLDMLGNIDAVLLARDDAENHMVYGEPFMEAGLPIYIDKPLGYSIEQVEKLRSMETYLGQIFSCSALRFSNTILPSASEEKDIGNLLEVRALGPGSWQKYSIHLLDALFDRLALSQATLKDVSDIGLVLSSPLCPNIRIEIDPHMEKRVFTFSFIGTEGALEKRFDDTFASFKAALSFFVSGAYRKQSEQFWSRYRDIASIIEMRVP